MSVHDNDYKSKGPKFLWFLVYLIAFIALVIYIYKRNMDGI